MIKAKSRQVIELLAHPGRLKNGYERRLGILEEKEKTDPDTAALERQRLQLEKGNSRLIDSYAEGMIDKMDFDPKMRNLKSRLEQLDQQIQESRRHQVGQRELFLVINRLEEFAAAVHDRLGAVDFVTKREIIRGLVKRVEIHKHEILVVFRVDPDPGFTPARRRLAQAPEKKVCKIVRGVISPLLANIYLHYVLDLWARQWRERHARGDVIVVRYADDSVVGFRTQWRLSSFSCSCRSAWPSLDCPSMPRKHG